MAHTTKIGNFSVASVEFGVTQGTNIADTQSTAVLTLIPDEGFTLTAADFSYTSGPAEVQSVSFSQSGNNVLATVTFAAGASMPASDLDIPICIAGESGLVQYTLSGVVETIASSNVTPASGNTSFSISGNVGDDAQAFSHTVTAGSGYYFPVSPSGNLTVGDANNYSFTTSEATNDELQITGKTFTGVYTFPAANVANNVFTVVAEAVEIPVIIREITSYTINKANIDDSGETRQMVIFGNEGAQFSLTVVNEDGTSILTSPLSNVTIPAIGSYTFNITFPAVTDTDDYDFVLTGDLASTFDTPQGQESTFTINQYLDINLTFQLITVNSDLTPGANFTLEYKPNKDLEVGDSNYSFQGELTVISTTPIIENTPPLVNSFTNLTAASNGGTDTTITSVSSALSNSDLTYTISFEGITEQTGIDDVLSQLDLDFLISTNTTPVANESSYTTNEDTGILLTLSATDADGDSLTYTIISGPSNGTFYESQGGTEITSYPHILPAATVWYEPDLNYNGSDSFTVQVNDGTTDSNIATNAITVLPVNDPPIISPIPWEVAGSFTTEGNTITNASVEDYVFSEGDSFTATATAVDVEDAQTDLTWSIISEFDATSTGDTSTPTWITGSVNADGSYTITADATGIRAGSTVFYLKVVDTANDFDIQKVVLGGIVPNVNSYFKFWFDSSGSMAETEGYLNRDFLGSGGTWPYVGHPQEYTVTGYSNPYTNVECLRYYLQDFYATGLTQAEEDAQGITNNPATNGSDEFDAKVDVVPNGGEGPHRLLNNNGADASVFSDSVFPNASSVVISVFMDESDNIASFSVGLDSSSGGQYPKNYQGAWSSVTTYNADDTVLYQNNLYRCLTNAHNSSTSPNADATNWGLPRPSTSPNTSSSSLIQELANKEGIQQVLNLKSTITSLNNNKGPGFYRGLFYPVKVNNQSSNESALEQYYKASVNNDFQFDENSNVYAADEHLQFQGAWVSGSDYVQDDTVRYNNNIYRADNNINSSTTTPDQDVFNWSSVSDSAQAKDLNSLGHLTAAADVELLDDGNTTPGYYTKRVVEELIALGYSIPSYQGTN
jgi:hypothetical protein